MAAGSSKARLEINRNTARPIVELVVPPGTKLVDASKLAEIISKEVLAHIGPVGCGPCISGVDFHIREDMGELINIAVNVEAGQFVNAGELGALRR